MSLWDKYLGRERHIRIRMISDQPGLKAGRGYLLPEYLAEKYILHGQALRLSPQRRKG